MNDDVDPAFLRGITEPRFSRRRLLRAAGGGAAGVGWAFSIDDFIITSFVAGQTLTFPLWVYGSVKVGIPPQVFVMGTLIFLAGVIFAAASVVAQRRGAAAVDARARPVT
jgi:ABC-type spermidine/putrescine transport system permease subunit II